MCEEIEEAVQRVLVEARRDVELQWVQVHVGFEARVAVLRVGCQQVHPTPSLPHLPSVMLMCNHSQNSW